MKDQILYTENTSPKHNDEMKLDKRNKSDSKKVDWEEIEHSAKSASISDHDAGAPLSQNVHGVDIQNNYSNQMDGT